MRKNEVRYESIDIRIKDFIATSLYIEKRIDEYEYVHEKLKCKKGLFLYGCTGSGKTYTLDAIAKKTGSRVNNWVELLFEAKDRISNGTVKSFIDNLTEEDFIFLDDIGAEKSTEWVLELLYLIIDRCYRYRLGLFISTNLSLQNFADRYGERLMSRIAELCEVIEMREKDYRLIEN